MASLEPPFQGDNLITLGNNIASKKPKQLPHVFSSKFRSFVEFLMTKNPKDRPTASEAISRMPGFAKRLKILDTSTHLQKPKTPKQSVKNSEVP